MTHFNLTKIPSSAPEVMDYRRMVTSLAQIGVVNTDGGFTLTGDGVAENVPGARVSASVFTILRVKPVAEDYLRLPRNRLDRTGSR